MSKPDRKRPEPKADTFKELRLIKGYNRSELADKANLGTKTLYNIEKGYYDTEPRGKTYGKLSEELGVSMDELRRVIRNSLGIDDDD